jgi:HEAT repeat protein
MNVKRVSEPGKKAGRVQTASSRGFEKELAELEMLREGFTAGAAPDAAAIQQLRKALGHRNNLLVAKAAKVAAEVEIAALLPDVLAAFERFFVDAAKSDPQCWAKNALAKALVKLEHRGKDAYLRGMRHHQMEPVWGGQSDTAGALRGTCTHALVDCPGISDAELLAALLEPLTDDDKTVRVEAARALGQVGGVSAALLLRLLAMRSKDEPEAEVMGAVYSSLLGLEGAAAIPLVAEALEDGGERSGEAAFALAEMRHAEALKALLARLRDGADAWFGSVLLSAIAVTRLPEAIDFLLALIADDGREAAEAIEAVGRIAPSAELRARVEAAVEQADCPRLRRALREHLPPIPE